ncbi:MAG: DNA/RNA nuclease SfsA, partial [Rickettsiales bacterium]|nr:DNA/RNA nuclease SfsA [Rickettsiales bacterium]
IYEFSTKLIEGTIISRINRFIFEVKIDDKIYMCHCPATGRIADIIFNNIPCLLSKSENENRKTPWTVEAISLDNKEWIGINQNKANRYIEHFFKTNQLKNIIDFNGNLDREKNIGDSKIDFIIENNYVEVKTPLIFLSPKNGIGEHIIHKKHEPFNSFDRFVKHLNALSNNIKDKQRAILITLFLYDAKTFIPPMSSTSVSIKIKKEVEKAISKGVEMWQVNLGIDKYGVRLLDYFNITNQLFNNKSIVKNNIDEPPHLITSFENRVRAFIQIQNGCDHHCTFCATRIARGHSVSIEPKHIIKQINLLKDYKEITLTGIDITDYGKGIKEKINLGQLIKKILKETDLQRLRLSSLDIADINDDLKDVLYNEKRVMPHIHLSLQSGDDVILKRMNRRHNRKQILDFCKEIRQYKTNISIGADFIAGFPTETDEMHKNTCELIKEVFIVFGHVFPYSIRANTPAAKMEQQLSNSVKKQRAKELRNLCDNNLKEFMSQELKKPQKILVESETVGRTENYLTVNLDNEKRIGEIIEVNL